MKLIILGTGGFASDSFTYLENEGFDIIGCLGVNSPGVNSNVLDKYLGLIENHKFDSKIYYFVGMGKRSGRAYCYNLLNGHGITPITYKHPSAVIHPSSKIGNGVYIGPFCVVGSNAIVSDNCFLNKFNNIGHNTRIGVTTLLYPYACINGNCLVGNEVIISTGAILYPNVNLPDRTVISSGIHIKTNAK